MMMLFIRLIFIVLLSICLAESAFSESVVSQDKVTSYLIKEINAYRASYGLSPVQTSKETCDFAKIRAHEITTDFSHNGFNARYRDKKLPYKAWSEVNENIAMTSDYKKVVSIWANSPGHAKNMRADTPYVCVAQDGDYFAYLGMRPKQT